MTARLALGTCQLGVAYGATNQVGLPSVQEAEGILEEARAVGVGVLDTAHDYGLSEERIGAALQRVPLEERPIVVTKTANSNDAGSAEAATEIIARGVDVSLERLQVSSLHTVLLHHYRQYTDHGGAAWKALLAAQEQGLIERVGVSTYEPPEVMEALSDTKIQHIQLPFSLLSEPFKTQEFASAVAARPEVVIHVRSIYLQGILLAESSKWPRFAQESGLADRVISCLEQLVVQLGRRDRVDLCLGYARGLCWVTHIVLGAETIQQVKQNAEYCSLPALNEDEIRVVDETVRALDIPNRLLLPGQWADEELTWPNGRPDKE